MPQPLGLLPGRALVLQPLRSFDGQPTSSLVRAWEPATNGLETLLVTKPGASVQLSGVGGRLFEKFRAEGDEPRYRVHELASGVVASSEPIALQLSAISGDGNFVVDETLRRFKAAGELSFDFAPLLSVTLPAGARYAALSFTGDAVAVPTVTSPMGADETGEWQITLANDDGTVLQLANAPRLDDCCDSGERIGCAPDCGLSFSQDGRYLLGVRRGHRLRAWDTGTGEVVLSIDEPGVQGATFLHGTNRLLIVRESGASEQNIDGTGQLAWSLDDYRLVTGPDGALGYNDGALVLAARDQVTARWLQPNQTWASAVSVTDTEAFAIVPDPDFDAPFPLMVARYAANRAGPTAVFRPRETQSEWEGQIALSPDAQRIAVVFPDSIRILNATTLEPLASLATGAGYIAWSPDGRYVAASPDLHYRDDGRPAPDASKTLSFWDASSGELAAKYATPIHTFGFAFSADGTKVVGWGQTMQVDEASRSSGGALTWFAPFDDAQSFSMDVLSGQVTGNDLGPQIGWTREVIATEQGIFRISTSELISAFEAVDGELNAPKRVVFAPDASVGAVAFDIPMQGKLFGVLQAEEARSAPFGDWRVGLSLSPGGRRFAVGEGVYCASPE
ncbi:MAG TPA: WD40 repeat domain-containing protein [Polyangiaceae bacterium]|nr:WD40 repeat domain-containing protein [Polyangiaceae bacterium]